MNHRTEISTLLLTQHGLITKQQVLAAGFTARTISRALDRGAYEEVLPGVLRSVQHPVTFESRAMAVQLHAGSGAALSGPTAARIYGLRGMFREHVWVRTARRSRARLPKWVTRTESAWLFEGDDVVRERDGWRLLAPAPMLLTLAEIFNDHRFERAAEDAWHLAIVTPHEAADFLDMHHSRGRRGIAGFARWIDKTSARRQPSQSEFELDVLDAVRRAGLPEPERQYPVTLATGEVVHLDLAWPDAQLAVEPGHSWWHGGDLKARADFARDRACGEVGWHVMRYDESARDDLPGLGAEVLSTYRRRRREVVSPFRGAV
jgi:hypothetical protein